MQATTVFLKIAIRAGSLYAPLAHKQYRSKSRRKKGGRGSRPFFSAKRKPGRRQSALLLRE
jgi:hypothetical protein